MFTDLDRAVQGVVALLVNAYNVSGAPTAKRSGGIGKLWNVAASKYSYRFNPLPGCGLRWEPAYRMHQPVQHPGLRGVHIQYRIQFFGTGRADKVSAEK